MDGSRLVAVGTAGSAAAWYSDDGGNTWRAAEVPPGGEESRMTSVAIGPDGLVAVGWIAGGSGDATPAAWHSADGSAWTLVVRGDGPGWLVDVAYGGDGWVAVGSNDLGGGQGLAGDEARLGLTAVSADGQSWTFLGPLPDAQLFSVVATPGGWMAAGQRGPDAMLWTSGAANARFESGWPAIEPLACPPAAGTIDLAALLAVPAATRRACLGRTEVTFRGWVVPQEGRGGTCSGTPAWLTCRLNVPADQVRAQASLDGPTLGVIPRPTAAMPAAWEGILPAATWVEVTGHFDDPAAATCTGATFQSVDTPARLVGWCRAQFVATRVAPAP